MKSVNKVAVLLVCSLGLASCGITSFGAPSPSTEPKTLELVKGYAQTALSKVKLAGDSCELVDIENVRTQVVAGTKYFADLSYRCGSATSKCGLSIVDPIGSDDLKFFWECDEFKQFDTPLRRKRGIKGGKNPVTDPEKVKEVEELVKHAFEKVDFKDNGPCRYLGAENMQYQVVAGTKYFADVKYICGSVTSTCPLTISNEIADAPSQFFWECPEIKALVQRRRRQVPGGITLSTDAEQINFFKQQTEAELAKKNLNGFPCTLDRVENVRTQVVAGAKYYGDVFYKCGVTAAKCEAEILDTHQPGGVTYKWLCDEF
jgi:hypothetical protein